MTKAKEFELILIHSKFNYVFNARVRPIHQIGAENDKIAMEDSIAGR